MTADKHNEDPFYWVDDDFIKAVVSVGAKLPGRDNDPAARLPGPAMHSRPDTPSKMKALADRLRGVK